MLNLIIFLQFSFPTFLVHILHICSIDLLAPPPPNSSYFTCLIINLLIFLFLPITSHHPNSPETSMTLMITPFSHPPPPLQNNEYLQTVVRCLQMMLRIDVYRNAFLKVDGITALVPPIYWLTYNNSRLSLITLYLTNTWLISYS